MLYKHRKPQTKILATYSDDNSPQHLVSVEDDGPRDVVLGHLIDGLGLNPGVGDLVLVHVLGGNHMIHTLLDENL